jgi:hypothetical protein
MDSRERLEKENPLNSNTPIFLTKHEQPFPLERPGLRIRSDGDSSDSAGGKIWVEGVLALDDIELSIEACAKWIRSIYVSVVSLGNQRPYCVNLIQDQVLFGTEFYTGLLESGQPVKQSDFRFELMTVLGFKLPPETYFIGVSARQYRSNDLVREVA